MRISCFEVQKALKRGNVAPGKGFKEGERALLGLFVVVALNDASSGLNLLWERSYAMFTPRYQSGSCPTSPAGIHSARRPRYLGHCFPSDSNDPRGSAVNTFEDLIYLGAQSHGFNCLMFEGPHLII